MGSFAGACMGPPPGAGDGAGERRALLVVLLRLTPEGADGDLGIRWDVVRSMLGVFGSVGGVGAARYGCGAEMAAPLEVVVIEAFLGGAGAGRGLERSDEGVGGTAAGLMPPILSQTEPPSARPS